MKAVILIPPAVSQEFPIIYTAYMITVVIKVFYAYKIQTFLFTFCCDDWVTLGPLKLSRVNLVCSCEDFMKSPWPQSRPEAGHTLPGDRTFLLLDLKHAKDNIIRGESNLLPEAIFYSKPPGQIQTGWHCSPPPWGRARGTRGRQLGVWPATGRRCGHGDFIISLR